VFHLQGFRRGCWVSWFFTSVSKIGLSPFDRQLVLELEIKTGWQASKLGASVGAIVRHEADRY